MSMALWVWFASVCFADAKNKNLVHPDGPSTTRPAVTDTSRLGANITSPTISSPPPSVTRRQKPLKTTDDGVDRRQEVEAKNSSDKEAQVLEAASKRNTNVVGGTGSGALSAAIRGASSSSATAEQLRSATSLAGNLALLLISVVIAGALFVMVVCFIHKWKENMGTG